MEAMVYSEELQRTQKGERGLLALGIFSIVMLFAGLTSAYVVRHDGGSWFAITLPDIFKISTALILFSSVTINFALMAYRKDQRLIGSLMLGLTLILGLGFAWCQWQGWSEFVRNGIYLVPPKNQTALASGSFIYLLTGLHLVHMAGGIIGLLITFTKGALGYYSSSNVHGVRLCSIYWHFLDGLWIYLFLFLTFFK
jgi:cytochrome c oxidase subunit 3